MGLCGNSTPDCTKWREPGETVTFKADPEITGVGVRLPNFLSFETLSSIATGVLITPLDHPCFSTHNLCRVLLHFGELRFEN